MESGRTSDPISSLLDAELVHAHPDHPSETVLERLAHSGGLLPIVSRDDAQRILGVVTFPHIMLFLRARRAEAGATSFGPRRCGLARVSDSARAMRAGRDDERQGPGRESSTMGSAARTISSPIRASTPSVTWAFGRSGSSPGQRVLEIGCGTGHASGQPGGRRWSERSRVTASISPRE